MIGDEHGIIKFMQWLWLITCALALTYFPIALVVELVRRVME